jgi:hypothetical protein
LDKKQKANALLAKIMWDLANKRLYLTRISSKYRRVFTPACFT